MEFGVYHKHKYRFKIKIIIHELRGQKMEGAQERLILMSITLMKITN